MASIRLIAKLLIIAIPTYAVAILTKQMIFVLPTLVISGLLANAVPSSTGKGTETSKDPEVRVDDSEDVESGSVGDVEAE